jgi:ABC-type transport system involved in cytochrome bd biosynthesis fused ATPase/permease subunit
LQTVLSLTFCSFVLIVIIMFGLVQVCDVISHPVHGTRVYPATLVTNAPLSVLLPALEKAGRAVLVAADDAGHEAGRTGAALTATAALMPRFSLPPLSSVIPRDLLPSPSEPLVALRALSVDTPAGIPAVVDLELSVHSSDHILVTGPSGCGKSTLLRALAKLWGVQVMVLARIIR